MKVKTKVGNKMALLSQRSQRASTPKGRVLNLNQIMAISTVTDEEKTHAYKTGHFAEVSLKLAGLAN